MVTVTLLDCPALSDRDCTLLAILKIAAPSSLVSKLKHRASALWVGVSIEISAAPICGAIEVARGALNQTGLGVSPSVQFAAEQKL